MDKLPSLESILAEPDCGSLSGTDDDVGAVSLEKLSTSETVSVGSLLSLNSPSRPKTKEPPLSGVILRHLILKRICAQIASASVSFFLNHYIVVFFLAHILKYTLIFYSLRIK